MPDEDLAGLARLSAPFSAVTVESHASTIGMPSLAFARQIAGRLEVAVGLETIHPVAAAQINKRLDLARFDRAARTLSASDVDLRVFVLLGVPYVRSAESVAWTVRTVEHAVERGAAMVSIIPVRSGNGEMERLAEQGHVVPPTLEQLEDALDACVQFTGTVVTADLWDIERLAVCAECRAPRVERLRRLNLSGRPEPRVVCGQCGPA